MNAARNAAHNAARHAAERYVTAVNAANGDQLLALFAEQATLLHPTGRYDGHQAIRELYETIVFAGRAQLRPGRLLAEGDTAMLELFATSPLAEPGSPPLRTLDVFTVDAAGAITELVVYYLEHRAG